MTHEFSHTHARYVGGYVCGNRGLGRACMKSHHYKKIYNLEIKFSVINSLLIKFRNGLKKNLSVSNKSVTNLLETKSNKPLPNLKSYL